MYWEPVREPFQVKITKKENETVVLFQDFKTRKKLAKMWEGN